MNQLFNLCLGSIFFYVIIIASSSFLLVADSINQNAVIGFYDFCDS